MSKNKQWSNKNVHQSKYFYNLQWPYINITKISISKRIKLLFFYYLSTLSLLFTQGLNTHMTRTITDLKEWVIMPKIKMPKFQFHQAVEQYPIS